MDALRLSLLIFGAFLVGGVYLWSSHVQNKRREQRMGWEGPDSHTISNVNINDEGGNNFNVVIPNGDEEISFTSDDATTTNEVEKIYTQDIASENISFGNTEEISAISESISDSKKSDEDDPQTPSVFVKPKVYESKLDKTKSHIKAVHKQEREQQVEQAHSPKVGAKASGNGLVVVINLLARPGLEFKGEKILRSVENAGLKYGDMNIFHFSGPSSNARPDSDLESDLESESGERQSGHFMFSLTNLVNPGTFDREQMTTLTTPGLTLFMQLPGPENGVKTFEKMLNTAQTLKKELDGELCDETRSALTYQTISHIKERIKEYCFKYQQA